MPHKNIVYFTPNTPKVNLRDCNWIDSWYVGPLTIMSHKKFTTIYFKFTLVKVNLLECGSQNPRFLGPCPRPHWLKSQIHSVRPSIVTLYFVRPQEQLGIVILLVRSTLHLSPRHQGPHLHERMYNKNSPKVVLGPCNPNNHLTTNPVPRTKRVALPPNRYWQNSPYI